MSLSEFEAGPDIDDSRRLFSFHSFEQFQRVHVISLWCDPAGDTITLLAA